MGFAPISLDKYAKIDLKSNPSKDNPDRLLCKYVINQLDNDDNLVQVAIINIDSSFASRFLANVHEFSNSGQKLENINKVHSLTFFKDYVYSSVGPIPYSYIIK